MPRIYWTPKRKNVLLKDAEKMTLKQLARKYFQPVAEIERMLDQLNPRSAKLIRTYRWRGHTVKVYSPGYAAGVWQQQVGEQHAHY